MALPISLLVLLAIPLTSLGAEPPAFFGQHFPHGFDAVEYLYGTDGMWRDQTGVRYEWSYSASCATSDRPANLSALLAYGATRNATAPDANCILLGDLNHDGDIADDAPTGYAFHEHTGRGMRGEQVGSPFYQFWFDDNWLATYMAASYERALPSGLHDNGYVLRWRVIGGDNSNWIPYLPSANVDRTALNGLYKLNAGDFNSALSDWQAIKNASGWSYVQYNQRYEYSSILETYHLALWAILSERLLAAGDNFPQRNDVLQHAISLRSNLLSLQEQDAQGRRLGWITGIGDPITLINTETLSLAVLALGANAKWVLEPGYAPMWSAAGNYFLRPHNVLSAVVGLSNPGHIVYGPYWNVPVGVYDVEFSLRTPSRSKGGTLAIVDVYDGVSILRIAAVPVNRVSGGNEWIRYRMSATVTNPANLLEFRVYWPGRFNLDVGPVRVTPRSAAATNRFAYDIQRTSSSKEPLLQLGLKESRAGRGTR